VASTVPCAKIIYTSFQTHNHIRALSLNFTGYMLSLTPVQQNQNTAGKI